jgi:hypothetical protein
MMMLQVLAFDCDPRSMACLRLIAENHDADRVLFGYMHRVHAPGEASDAEFFISFLLYDREENDVIRSIDYLDPLVEREAFFQIGQQAVEQLFQ